MNEQGVGSSGQLAKMQTSVESATSGRCIPIPTEAEWYCAQIDAGKERRLEEAFARVGIDTYMPLGVARRERSSRVFIPSERKYVERTSVYRIEVPLFAGYLFARMGDPEWTRSKTLLGTKVKPSWVSFGNGPVVVPPEVLEAIARGCESPESKARAKAPYEEGDQIEIVSGPLAGLSAIFSHDANERIFALIELLGRRTLVDVDLRQTRLAVASVS